MSPHGRSAALKRRPDPVTAVRVLLLATAVLTPVVFDLGTIKPFDIVKVTTLSVLGLLALGAWLACVALGRARARRFTMGWLAGAYLATAAVGTILSPTRWTSLFGWYGRYGGLVTIVLYVLIFYVVSCVYFERPDRTHEVIYAMAAGAIVLTTYIWIQRLGIDPIGWAKPGGFEVGQPYFGTMGNANFAGGYLGITSPWLYSAYRTAMDGWKRHALVGWGLIELGALWFTGARNGIVALTAALGMLLFVHRRQVPLALKLVAATLAVSALTLAVVVVWHPGSDAPPAALQRVDFLRSETLRVRWYWWVAGMHMFADRPLIGWGPEGFVTQHHRYLPAAAGAIPEGETADKPHNVFVEHAAHTGILGLGAYLALIFLAFRRGFARAPEGRQRSEHPLRTTLVSMLAAYLGQAFFSIDATAIGLVGWMVLGCIAALDAPTRTKKAPARTSSKPVARRVMAVAAVLAALVLAIGSTRGLRGDHAAKDAMELTEANLPFGDAMMQHERAESLHPYEPQYRSMAGFALEKEGLEATDLTDKRAYLSDAVARFRKMSELQPGYHVWLGTLAREVGLLAAVGGASFSEAEELYAEARRRGPVDWRIPTAQGDTHRLWAQISKDQTRRTRFMCASLVDYEDALEIRPWAKAALLGYARSLADVGRRDEGVDALYRALDLPQEPERDAELEAELDDLEKDTKRPRKVRCP